MTTRREQILGTAAELFAARGFHGVSVADLGAACGISGPALYKHFVSKDAVLAEMLVSISRWRQDSAGRLRTSLQVFCSQRRRSSALVGTLSVPGLIL